MNGNSGIRQFHRWTSIVFVVAVIFNTVMLMLGRQATWVGLTALFPLILLMITGLYMFALPYLAKDRKPSRATEGA
jgi:ATP/ADP translocase